MSNVIEWYSPASIKYSEVQILWLLRNVLFQDTWPSDHKETGCAGGKGKTPGYHANYETIKIIIGELNARLKQCGIAGWYLEDLTRNDYVDYDYLLARLAGYTRVTPREVNYQSKMAMRYCCGRSRKLVTFDRFCTRTKSDDKARNKRTGG